MYTVTFPTTDRVHDIVRASMRDFSPVTRQVAVDVMLAILSECETHPAPRVTEPVRRAEEMRKEVSGPYEVLPETVGRQACYVINGPACSFIVGYRPRKDQDFSNAEGEARIWQGRLNEAYRLGAACVSTDRAVKPKPDEPRWTVSGERPAEPTRPCCVCTGKGYVELPHQACLGCHGWGEVARSSPVATPAAKVTDHAANIATPEPKSVMRQAKTLVTARDELCTIKDCPPGPFLFQGQLCFKSATGGTDATQVFALTGEHFWGGVQTCNERGALLVMPMKVVSV